MLIVVLDVKELGQRSTECNFLHLRPLLPFVSINMCRSRGGDRRCGPPTPKNYKNLGFLAIMVRIPWKITKLPSQHSMLGYHRPASETKWRFAGGPIMARFLWYLDPLSPHQGKKVIKKVKRKRKKVGPPWQNFLDPGRHFYNKSHSIDSLRPIT